MKFRPEATVINDRGKLQKVTIIWGIPEPHDPPDYGMNSEFLQHTYGLFSVYLEGFVTDMCVLVIGPYKYPKTLYCSNLFAVTTDEVGVYSMSWVRCTPLPDVCKDIAILKKLIAGEISAVR